MKTARETLDIITAYEETGSYRAAAELCGTTHHIQVAKALYSIPGALIGETVTVRVDSRLVKVLFRGQVVKIHPKQPAGRRSTDETDLPSEVTVYAMRDLDKLQRMAARHGPAIGTYATALLDIPLPWTKMRQVYRLLEPGQEVRGRPGRAGLCPGAGMRSGRRRV